MTAGRSREFNPSKGSLHPTDWKETLEQPRSQKSSSTRSLCAWNNPTQADAMEEAASSFSTQDSSTWLLQDPGSSPSFHDQEPRTSSGAQVLLVPDASCFVHTTAVASSSLDHTLEDALKITTRFKNMLHAPGHACAEEGKSAIQRSTTRRLQTGVVSRHHNTSELGERPASDLPSFVLNKCICTDWDGIQKIVSKISALVIKMSIRSGNGSKRKRTTENRSPKNDLHRSHGDWQILKSPALRRRLRIWPILAPLPL